MDRSCKEEGPRQAPTAPSVQRSWLKPLRFEMLKCDRFHAVGAVWGLNPGAAQSHVHTSDFPYKLSPPSRDSEWSLPAPQWILRNCCNYYNFLCSLATDLEYNANKIFLLILAFIALKLCSYEVGQFAYH